MSKLAVQAQIVRIYAEAARAAFGPMLERDDAAAQLARLFLELADSTASCAEEIAVAQQSLEHLMQQLGVGPPPPARFRVIDGGQN